MESTAVQALPIPAPAPKRAPRMLALDLLRAAAVLLVLGRHAPVIPEGSNDLAQAFSEFWFRFGWVGVDIFFVLSGFLVSGLLFREFSQRGKLDVKQFFIRRGFKIYPSFYLLLLVSFLLDLELGTRQMSLDTLLGEALYLRNYGYGIWNHTWSLAVEEHFYLLLPLFLLLLIHLFRKSENPFRNLPVILLGMAAVMLVARWLTYWSGPAQLSMVLYGTHLRIDSLAFGVVLGYLYAFQPIRLMHFGRQHRWLLLILGFVLLSPAFIFDPETHWWIPTFGFTVFYLASGMILLAALSFKLPLNFVTRPFAYVGVQSYSIYIWHMAVLIWVLPVVVDIFGLHLNPTIRFALYFVVSLALGCILGELIERPMLSLRDRFFPSKAKGAVVPPVPQVSEPSGTSAPSAQ